MCWVFVFVQVWVAVMVPVNAVGCHLLVHQSLTLLNISALWAFVKSEMGQGILCMWQSIFLLHCRLYVCSCTGVGVYIWFRFCVCLLLNSCIHLEVERVVVGWQWLGEHEG